MLGLKVCILLFIGNYIFILFFLSVWFRCIIILFYINILYCILEFFRKLFRVKFCFDFNRIREFGEVEFDIEVGVCFRFGKGISIVCI